MKVNVYAMFGVCLNTTYKVDIFMYIKKSTLEEKYISWLLNACPRILV